MSKNSLLSANTNTYFEIDSEKNIQTEFNKDYEIWFNEKDKLEYVRLRPEGLKKLANQYQTRTDKPQTSSISVVEFKTESGEFSFHREHHSNYLEELKKELEKVNNALVNGETQGMLFCITGKNGNSIHTIPFLVQKDNSGNSKILDFEDHLKEDPNPTEERRVIKIENYIGAQKSLHGCGTFALDTVKNCLTDHWFLDALLKTQTQNDKFTLPKMVLGQGKDYNSKLSADKKSKYVIDDVNRKSLYKSHQYAQLLNPNHLASLQKSETLELILKVSQARTTAKLKPLSFDQWLKQKWGVVAKNENTSAEARGETWVKNSDDPHDLVKKKLPIVNYSFESYFDKDKEFNAANRFVNHFKIKPILAISSNHTSESVFIDNVSGGKNTVAVRPEKLIEIEKDYEEYKKKFLNTNADDLLHEQKELLNLAVGQLNNEFIKERVDHIHNVSRGEKDGVFPHLSISGYKAALDAYVAINYQNLSASERSELNKRSGWLFGYGKTDYQLEPFSGLKADANFLNVIGGVQYGLYQQGVNSNQDSVEKIENAAIADAACQVDGVGRNSSQKRSAPGFGDTAVGSTVLVQINPQNKWKVVPRMVVGKDGNNVLIPETNRILIEGGGMTRHSYTAEYWWKAKTTSGHEIETKRVVDNELLLGRDNGRDVRGAEVLLWKIPDKNFWIKKEDYGVERFCAVDEFGKSKDPQPSTQEITACIEVLKSAEYDYYRTEYNGGAGLHWAAKPQITSESTLTSGQAWIPYTVKINPYHKISSQSSGMFGAKTSVKNVEKSKDSIAEDIKARIVAERMSKLYNPTAQFLAGSNPNDPATISASSGDADWKKWHDLIEPLDENNQLLDKMVPEYSRKMAIQHSGNCAEINKFYALLGPEKSSVDEILQEFRSLFVKAKNCDKILEDIDNKLVEIDSLGQAEIAEDGIMLNNFLKYGIKLEEQKIINDRIKELASLKDETTKKTSAKKGEHASEDLTKKGKNRFLEPKPKEIKTQRMEVGTDGKITLNLKNSKTGDSQIVIEKDENIFLEVDNSSGTPQVTIKNDDFKKELMKYYLRDKGSREAREKYDVSQEKTSTKLNDHALQVLNIYRAVPRTSVAVRSAERIVISVPTKPH